MVLSFLVPTKSNSIDYSQPYNVVPSYLRVMGAASTYTVENDWIQTSAYRSFVGEVDVSSVRVSAVGSDIYGTKYEKWLSIYINGGQYSGRLIYDSGWTIGDIDDNIVLYTSEFTSVRIVYRLRYTDTTANPPNLSYLNNASVLIYYNSLQQVVQETQTTAIPEYWQGTQTVTVSTMDLGSFGQQTTSVAIDSFLENASQDIEYSFATIFGLLDSGESLVVIMNYLDEKLPYLYAITFFSLLTAIGVWAIR